MTPKEYHHQHYLKNRERITAQNKAYRLAHIQKFRAYRREHYQRNKAAIVVREAERLRYNRDLIDTFKDVPCADCGHRFPSYVMDFDHVRGAKRKAIGQMLTANPDAIIEEILKCEVVCSNCHRIRTHVRKAAVACT